MLGICNGFQVLLEAGLLPGAMVRNDRIKFVSQMVSIRVEQTDTPFTAACTVNQVLRMPIAHGEGNYYAAPEVLAELEKNRQVIFRYTNAAGEVGVDWNPNGSLNSIAGICNRERNVVGLMPHPERASELSLGSDDGRIVLASAVKFFQGLKTSRPPPRGRRASRTRMTVIDTAVLERHGIKPDEYERIQHLLGRDPNLLELGLFSVMWSEHCSYKSSRVHLKTLPTTGARVVQGPGENAGAVDIGDGLCAVFKIESHNHPSFIEPYQGAATGVGGIIRDIFTMGARPIALLNALRFGSLDTPLARRIFEGVVAGIGGYGNSIGIPTVGGEIVFDEMYAGNPLVNVFCLGIARTDDIIKGAAKGVGNPVFYVGAKTGRDGIHGATMASAEFDEKSAEKRPAVQVGDPFMEKLLMEACLEVMKTGAVVGIQDMGAAGFTCSTSEMGSRGGVGMEVDVTHVPQRETGMTPYEIMLSESQERMLLVVERGREHEVEAVFEKWDLHAVKVGEVTDGTRLKIFERGTLVADVPNRALTDEAPVYQRPMEVPLWQKSVQEISFANLAPAPSAQQAFDQLIAVADHRQQAVGVSTVRSFGRHQHDRAARHVRRRSCASRTPPAVWRCRSTATAASAISTRYQGARLAVAEAARNVACVGAEPIGATNNLNFGNPERPEIMWQIGEVGARHRRRLSRAEHADHRRQRQSLQ